MTNELTITTEDSEGRHWQLTVDVCEFPKYYISKAVVTLGGFSTDTEEREVEGTLARKYLTNIEDLITDKMYEELEMEAMI